VDNSRPNLDASPCLTQVPYGRYAGWVTGPLLVLTGLALVPFGQQIHRIVQPGLSGLPLDDFWNTTRQFAATTGVLIVFSAIGLLLTGVRRRIVLTTLALALLAGAAVNEPIKRITGRIRPEFSTSLNARSQRSFDRKAAERYGQYELRADGTMQWLIGRGLNRPWFFDAYASFPSGHSNAAAVLSVVLAAAFPRGRWLWLVLGVGCALSRVRHDRHFLEDCLVGFGIGWIMAHLVVAYMHNRMEQTPPTDIRGLET
jgi:membrane-associated phospholipid phosphatase